MYFFCNRIIFHLLLSFLLKSFHSNVCFDSASAFHFLKICLLHHTFVEAFLQNKSFLLSLIHPDLFLFLTLLRHPVHLMPTLGSQHSAFWFSQCSPTSPRSCSVPHALLLLCCKSILKKIPRFPLVPYLPNSFFKAALQIFPFC